MAKTSKAIGAALLALALQGCSTAPRIEEHFGEAVRANLAAQVINPSAAVNANPARGIDGPSARAAQERYERSFAQPEKADAPLISTASGK